jgi:hypothetical protein
MLHLNKGHARVLSALRRTRGFLTTDFLQHTRYSYNFFVFAPKIHTTDFTCTMLTFARFALLAVYGLVSATLTAASSDVSGSRQLQSLPASCGSLGSSLQTCLSSIGISNVTTSTPCSNCYEAAFTTGSNQNVADCGGVNTLFCTTKANCAASCSNFTCTNETVAYSSCVLSSLVQGCSISCNGTITSSGNSTNNGGSNNSGSNLGGSNTSGAFNAPKLGIVTLLLLGIVLTTTS